MKTCLRHPWWYHPVAGEHSRPTLPVRAASVAFVLLPLLVAMQAPVHLPFAAGERLAYTVRAGPGLNGKGEMWVEGPLEMRGARVMVLNSDIHGGLGPFKASDRSTSWFDQDRMATLRFVKEEHNPLGSHSEDIEVNPSEQRWKSADGRAGVTQSDQPLDELSFIYVLRTLQLPDDSVLVLNRHFDPDRSPTTVRSLGAGSARTPAGTWATREIEMRVRDARRYRGEGVIRISLSDDACRRPVRIVSSIPGAGTITMLLAAAAPAIEECAAH